MKDLLDADDDAPIIRLINAMLSEAIKLEVSDIHIETFEKHLTIRFRIDGVLREILRPQTQTGLTAGLSYQGYGETGYRREAFATRWPHRPTHCGRAVDVRVSTMPSSYGERVVLRLLDKNNVRLELKQLGMTDANRHISPI